MTNLEVAARFVWNLCLQPANSLVISSDTLFMQLVSVAEFIRQSNFHQLCG